MASKKKEKSEHIQVKTDGIKLSNRIGDKLADASNKLENKIASNLIENSNTNISKWYIQQNNKIYNFKKASAAIIKETSDEIKKELKKDKDVSLTNNQVIDLTTQVDKGLLTLQNNATTTYQNIITDILLTLRSDTSIELKEVLSRRLKSITNVDVVYKDGKKYKFGSYWEMKARTEIQADIAKNMIQNGHENGIVFYITSFYGDCAPDHADYQGKIYYDKDWESIAPSDRIEEINRYIKSNDLKTVQEVTEGEPYLTSRPNCRHYFQYISIDEVLGIKNNTDLNTKREELNLNSNGRYQPEKYEALQKQRHNERKIRVEKQEVDYQKKLLRLNPENKEIQSKILVSEEKIRHYQSEQRKLIEKFDNLQRKYDREDYHEIVIDFGIEQNKSIKNTNQISIFDDDATKIDKAKRILPKQYDFPEKLKELIGSAGTIVIRDAGINRSGTIEHIVADHSKQFNDNYVQAIDKTIRDPDNIKCNIKNGRVELIGSYNPTNSTLKFLVVIDKENGTDEEYTVVTAYPLRKVKKSGNV